MYLRDFRNAVDKRDKEEAIFQLHLMLQRDPFDQKEQIIDAFVTYENSFGPSGEENDKFGMSKTNEVANVAQEQLSVFFGSLLYYFDTYPSQNLLDCIKITAEKMEKVGLLSRVPYLIGREEPTQNRKNKPHHKTITKQNTPFLSNLSKIAQTLGIKKR